MTIMTTTKSSPEESSPVKLKKISRVFFFMLTVTQAFLLSKFVVDHEEESGFFGLSVMFALPLCYWLGTLCRNGLKERLSVVWFLYSFVLVIMIGVIFGRIVIEDNKLREVEIASCLHNTTNVDNIHKSHSFFDSNFLKIVLCFTPGLMLLLLTSVTDESGVLNLLYLTTVMDLFDGVEMLEVLHEDVCDKVTKGWEIAVLVAAMLYFLLSFLEIHQVKFQENDEPKPRKKTTILNICFQIVLNFAFLVIRLVLWFKYDFDSAIFMAKNVIGLAIAVVDVLEKLKLIEL